ncbi:MULTISPECIES: sensor domain-containing protein [unclassified Rhizobium]|uniref:sensor domain-containing protein n=1 Tax=unclassified Rhizobium TaxID=2613769 RepID=UPI0017818BEE|nr:MULTISPECIES: diguanylate cyclase [unclassified Rhizobium]MBD8685665.1 diguanylate cyclase [Rhizobium sp. CFBP 13644]MBD8690662.1 diguanylate cyclase [Rhizobium sp. CFBP 13717]
MGEEKGARNPVVMDMNADFLLDGLSNSRMSYLLDNIPEMVFLKDAEGYYTYMNAACLACLGHEPTFLHGRRLTIYDIAPPEIARQLDEIDRRLLDTGNGSYNAEYNISFSDGQIRWFSGTHIPVRNDRGEIVGIAGISRDITEAKWQESLRRSHAALLEMIVHGKPLQLILEAVVRTVEDLLDNLTGSILFIEQNRLRNCVGPNLPESYVAAVDGVEIGADVGSCGTAAWLRQAVYVSDTFQDPLWSNFIELVMRHGLRSCWSTPIFGNNGVLLGTFALYSGTVRMPSAIEREIIDMATNIAGIAIDRRRAEDKVNYMAHHDPLTGLSNRNLFWSQFQRAIHEARRENRLVAVTYIDLDNFKEINDIYGHGVGDEVLRSLAERIKNCIRASDIAVRLGGDEFAIIFSNPQHDEPGILQRLETIRERAAEPIELNVGSLTVTCSSGTAFYPSDGETPEALLAKADAAMYEAKKGGRNGVRFFEQSCGDGI